MAETFRITLPVAGRLKLLFATFDGLVARLARHISQDGIFIPTDNPRPAGTLLALYVGLNSGEAILEAEGEVLYVRRNPEKGQSAGMGFRFINMSPPSQELVWRIAHKNRESGIKPEVVVESHVVAEAQAPEVLDLSADKHLKLDTPIIGIDFGTCNSSVGIMEDNQAKLIPADKGGLIIPSVLALAANGEILIGQAAKDQVLINPKDSVYGIKRFLGRKFRSPNVRHMRERFPYQLKADANDDILVTLGGRDYTLPEIVGMILAHLRECAEGHLQKEIRHAVISVPAYFTETQRGQMKLAASHAGLHLELMFNEPTAAALAYGYNKDYEKRVLVFDLGGGTFDVSVLEVAANIFEVKGAGGDAFLGGLDFDQRLIDFIVADFERREKVEIRKNQVVMQRITGAAEHAKIQLSEKPQTDIHLPFVADRKGKPVDLKMTITRDTLNDLTRDLVERTIEICGKTLHSMGMLPTDIHDVLLVGGQSRMPYLRDRLHDYFGREFSKGVNPDEAVAMGAALMGGSLSMIDGPMLLDILAISIMRSLPSNELMPLFKKRSALPCQIALPLSQLLQEHPEKSIPLYQGDDTQLHHNEYLGDVILSLNHLDGPADKIQVQFELSREGILDIQAIHAASNKKEKLALKMVRNQVIAGADSEAVSITSPGTAIPAVSKKPTKSLFAKFFNKA